MKRFVFLGGAMRLGVLAGILLGSCLAASGWTATLAERKKAASRMVNEALRDEMKDANAHRDGMLHQALEQAPDHTAARWHSGYVQHHDKWVKYDELPNRIAEDTRYVAYRIARAKAAETVRDQLMLADWWIREAENTFEDRPAQQAAPSQPIPAP